MDELGRVPARRRSGSERFISHGSFTASDLLGFWQWSCSDLLSNATRGRLAEYIVATALKISTRDVRDEWAAFDLVTADGLKVEVKSAAFLQSWFQRELSTIVFSVRKARAWSADTNRLLDTADRSADVYVFALLNHRDKQTVDPLNLDQWEFYVLSTAALNSRTRSQHSITLTSLKKMKAGPCSFDELVKAVAAAVAGESIPRIKSPPSPD